MKKQTIVLSAILIAIVIVIVYIIYMQTKSKDAIDNPNVKAFLKMIRYAEGTDGPEGYRTLFGGTRRNPKLFDNGYSGHPNIKNCVGSLCSTAAGAYQFLFSTWAYLKTRLFLNDFSPANQDLAAIELIREKNALNDVIAGNWTVAIAKVNRVWASLPGSPYGQPTKTLAELQTVYNNEGGTAYA